MVLANLIALLTQESNALQQQLALVKAQLEAAQSG